VPTLLAGDDGPSRRAKAKLMLRTVEGESALRPYRSRIFSHFSRGPAGYDCRLSTIPGCAFVGNSWSRTTAPFTSR
jgi:hypothetical protein